MYKAKQCVHKEVAWRAVSQLYQWAVLEHGHNFFFYAQVTFALQTLHRNHLLQGRENYLVMLQGHPASLTLESESGCMQAQTS